MMHETRQCVYGEAVGVPHSQFRDPNDPEVDWYCPVCIGIENDDLAEFEFTPKEAWRLRTGPTGVFDRRYDEAMYVFVGPEGTTTHTWEQCDAMDNDRHCCIHFPSDHALSTARIHIRFDRNMLAERICEHGIGHPDPDSLAYLQRNGVDDDGTHGCDGCCVEGALPEFKYLGSKVVPFGDLSDAEAVMLRVEKPSADASSMHVESDIGMHVPHERGTSMTTASGTRFFVFDPRPEEILIDDIAHALSNICRYGGHCAHFYSVAQHSVHVADVLAGDYVSLDDPIRKSARDIHGPLLSFIGLLHDAAEAYCGDIVRPMKMKLREAVGGSLFDEIEEKVMDAILEKEAVKEFCTISVWEAVKDADNILLATEKRDLHPNVKDEWLNLPAPAPFQIVYMSPDTAKMVFLDKYHSLKAQVNERLNRV